MDHRKSKQTNIYFFLTDYAKAFDYVDHKKLWKILKRDGTTRPPYLSPGKPVCRSKSNNLEPDMEHRTSSELKKEYIKAVYCHPAYLTYMQSTSCKMLDEAQAGIKISGRNINNLRYADDTTLMTESEEELKRFLMRVKEQSEKAGLKFNSKN